VPPGRHSPTSLASACLVDRGGSSCGILGEYRAFRRLNRGTSICSAWPTPALFVGPDGTTRSSPIYFLQDTGAPEDFRTTPAAHVTWPLRKIDAMTRSSCRDIVDISRSNHGRKFRSFMEPCWRCRSRTDRGQPVSICVIEHIARRYGDPLDARVRKSRGRAGRVLAAAAISISCAGGPSVGVLQCAPASPPRRRWRFSRCS